MKKILELNPLKTLEELQQDIDFVDYSTQRRNLAALLMLKDFFLKLEDNYLIDRGLAKLYKLNLLRLNVDVIEGLLYCALNQAGISIKKSKPGAGDLVDLAGKKKLISQAA